MKGDINVVELSLGVYGGKDSCVTGVGADMSVLPCMMHQNSLLLHVSTHAVLVLSLSGDQGQEGEHACQSSCGDQALHGSGDPG